MTNQAIYPDISDILKRKAQGRRDLAALPFAEKIARAEALRERLAPIKRAREARIASEALARQSSPANRE